MTKMTLQGRFERRLTRSLEDTFSEDKPLADFTNEILYESKLDAEEDWILAAGKAAIKLKALIPKEKVGKLAFTERVLHNALFHAWNHAEDEKIEAEFITPLLQYPSFTGVSPTVAQWKEAVKLALKNCCDAKKLKRLLVLSVNAEKNELLVSRAWGRYMELAPKHIRHFFARGLDALGDNPTAVHMISSEALVHTRILRVLAELSLKLGLHYLSNFEDQTLDIVWPNTIKICGNRRWPSTSRSTAEDITQLQTEIEITLKQKWTALKEKGPCTVCLVIEGLPKEIVLA